VYLGTIKRVVDFGCFIEIKPGVEGLCHISQLEDRRITDIYADFKEGQEVMVKVLEIDNTGRIKLSRREAMDKKPQ
jgi:polyribonucleotide nucleotidyltransferase